MSYISWYGNNTTEQAEIFIEFYKDNAWPLVVDNFLQSPAFIAILSAIALAIVMYGVSLLFRLQLKFDFGAETRAYNEGYIEGFKKAVEELSQHTHDKTTPLKEENKNDNI